MKKLSKTQIRLILVHGEETCLKVHRMHYKEGYGSIGIAAEMGLHWKTVECMIGAAEIILLEKGV